MLIVIFKTLLGDDKSTIIRTKDMLKTNLRLARNKK